MQESWKRLETETLFTHPRLTVVEDDVELPDGTRTKYMRWEGQKDYVTVIATRIGEIAMIKEYSYPHDEWLWQFPEGSIEGEESPEESTVRELREEAGLGSDSIERIGMNYGHHRRTTEKNYIMLAGDAYEVEKTGGDVEEQGTELHWVKLNEVKKMMAEGQIKQKNAMAALSLYLVHLG
jgi:ADP-ribose pyrophosphatase